MIDKKRYKNGIIFGDFDILNGGHLSFIRSASEMCYNLTVCVATDRYAEKKTNRKTIVPFRDRLRIVNYINIVNDVEYLDEDYNEDDIIGDYEPDVIFNNGNEYDKTLDNDSGIKIIHFNFSNPLNDKCILDIIKKNIDKM